MFITHFILEAEFLILSFSFDTIVIYSVTFATDITAMMKSCMIATRESVRCCRYYFEYLA